MSGPVAPATGRIDLRLTLPAVAAWVAAWQLRAVPAPWVLAGAAGLVLVSAVLLWGPQRGSAAAVAAVCVCSAAACVAVGARESSRTSGPVPLLAARGAAVTVTGTVTDDPRRVTAKPGAPRSADLQVLHLRADRLAVGARELRLRAPLLVLSSDPAWLGLLPSQQVRVEGRLQPARAGDDVAAVLSGRGPPDVLGRPSRVQRAAEVLRGGLRRAVAPLPEAERGLLPGLVVGDTSRLDAGLQADFRTTGLTHLTAVSGTNVSIVLLAALLLARTLGLPLLLRPLVGGLALAAFVVLARPSPSVLRAAVMGVVGLLALASGARRAALPALSAAVLVLVLLSPDLAATPGFALSVLATGGLLLLAQPWRDVLARRLPARVPGWVGDAVAVPAAAQVACGPVIVAISGQLGLLSVPANLLAAPAVAPATILGVAAALLAPVSLPLAQLAAWLAWLPTAWLVRVARYGAGVPGAAVPWPDGRRGALLLGGATAVALLVLSRRLLRRAGAACAAGALAATAALTVTGPAWPPPGWFLVSCDVGQGDAHVLRVAPHAAVVLDAGPDPRPVDECLRRLAIDSVPLVLLTHDHADHVEGLPGVLRGREVSRIELGPLEEPPQEYRRVLSWAAAAGVPVAAASLGEQQAAGGLSWEVIAPTRAYRGTHSDPNNSSLVLRLRVGALSVLLTGDIEPEAQQALVDSGVPLAADALKVPHHGSSHQLPTFLDAVGARVTVTSVGAGNTYGHPSAATLDRLVGLGARSFRTDQDGDVALVSRDGQLLAEARRGTGAVHGQLQAAPGAGPAAGTGPAGWRAPAAGPAVPVAPPALVDAQPVGAPQAVARRGRDPPRAGPAAGGTRRGRDPPDRTPVGR